MASIAATTLAASALVLGVSAPASAAVESIAFEAPNNNHVVLGDLASRSQRQPVSISGIGPYTVRGTDSTTNDPYEFVTDFNYDPSSSPGWARESDERTLSSAGTFNSTSGVSFDGRSGVLQLGSGGNCLSGNTFDGATTYCSMFGPDVYTKPFKAVDGQAVSFDWAAQRRSDDYEIYAFLVKVEGDGYGTPADHTLVAYGRGDTQGWTTTSKEIPEDGTYRFRFVNGSYDKTGGYALGSNMYIDSVVKLGLTNTIDFAPLSDRIVDSGGFTVSATAASGGAVTFSTTTSSVCSVSPTGDVTLNNTGTCSVVANEAGGGDYVPAETVTRSFRVLAEPTAPTNAGLPYLPSSVAEGDTITANEGTWTDGGSPITGTSFQWTSTVDGTTTSLPGETTDSCYLVEQPGSSLRVAVTKTNSVGSTTATSAPLVGYTCGAPAAPEWTSPGSLGTTEVGAPVSVTFAASGITAPTYSLVDGTLPAGLTFDAAAGTVSGTPTAAGAYTFTLRATNPTGTDDLVVSGTVNEGPGAITGAPAAFVVGTASSGTLAATGTPAPGFTVSNGALPVGVSLDAVTGEFSGTPTAAGPYEFTVTAQNGIGTPTTRVFSGTVTEAPGWRTSPGFAPQVGEPLDVTFTAEGTPAPVYSISEGALPAGLTLDPTTGQVTGTPTDAGAFSFVITATNDLGSSTLPVSGTVVAAPGPITGAPDHWVVGEPAAGTLSADATPAPLFVVTAGNLPQGVTLNPTTGQFEGTPTAPGDYSFTVTAMNGVGDNSTQAFSGTVDQAPAWNAHSGLALEVGTAVTTTYSASGTPAPTYSVSAGTLPAGLTFDPATGELSGTPTAPGPYSFTLAASNGIGTPAELVVTGIVEEEPAWDDTHLGTLRVGQEFTDAIRATGTPSPSYAVTAGSLPAGLTLDEVSGAITGTPTTAGDYAFTVTAANGVGDPIEHEFTGTVTLAPVVASPPRLPELTAGKRVSIDLSDGIAANPRPLFLLTSGELPTGMSLDPETGMLTGTPTTPGAYHFTITVDNGTGEVLTFEFSGEVAAAFSAGPNDEELATTGGEMPQATLFAGILLLLGGLLVTFRRRFTGRHTIG